MSKEELIKELEIRLPQIRYALKFNDWEFGLKHLEHLEKILLVSRQSEVKA